MAEKQYHVIVIGAGAAGMTAAIAALEEAAEIKKTEKSKERRAHTQNRPGTVSKALLLESNDRAGKKILATGNGKCNFTHKDVDLSHYHTDDTAVLESVLTGFPAKAALGFFEGLGMLSKEKNGHYYPLSETASTVLDVLRLRLTELGCDISCGIYIENIERAKDGFWIRYKEQEKIRRVYGRSVILATGSKAGGFLQNRQVDPLYPAKTLGLRCTLLYPALTKCICREDRYYRQLAGVRAQVRLSLYAKKDLRDGVGKKAGRKEKNAEDGWKFLRQERGELQLTKEGISGIVVFQLSGDIAQYLSKKNRVVVEINFLPDFPEEELSDWIRRRLSLLPGRSLEDFFLGVLHKKVLQACLQTEGLCGNMQIPEKEDGTMVYPVMKRAMHFKTEVMAVADMKQAQVCRGGLVLSQFDKKLECKTIPGLFACGEVLNVDGECGGYNLHFAWASGKLAGKEAMRRACGFT